MSLSKTLFSLTRPLLHRVEPETAHNATLLALRFGLAGQAIEPADPVLCCTRWGLEFANPVGLAAGFDKNALVPDAMLRLGFGFVEMGSVTPLPQSGNPRPRIFRVPAQEAVINRLGFNNEGLEVFARRLEDRRGIGRTAAGVVGANIGKNKDTADAADDYVKGVKRLATLADYLVVNVSSPNTPGLRALQGREQLADLVNRVLEARDSTGVRPPLLVKVAPDLTDEDKADIAEVALATSLDGLIVSNTTITRPPSLPADLAAQTGGLSGRPLMEPSTRTLADFYRLTGGKVTLIGTGGIASGDDAYAKIRAGASLVQLYTALIYQGPALVQAITRDLAARLKADGFASVDEAVGADVKGVAAT